MLMLEILIGVMLLLIGRKVVWLFVAGIGFVAAAEIVARLSGDQMGLLVIIAALVAGVIGAVLAIFLQKVAVGVVGFLAGGYIALSALKALRLETTAFSWLIVVVGGIVGVMLALVLLDWALILLSSISGAALIAQSSQLLGWYRVPAVVVFVIAAVVGIIVQARLLEKERS